MARPKGKGRFGLGFTCTSSMAPSFGGCGGCPATCGVCPAQPCALSSDPIGPSIWLPFAFLRITLYVISCAHIPTEVLIVK